MLKQSIIYLVLSILIVVFARYAELLIVYIDMVYTYVNVKLSLVLNHGTSGIILRNVLTLVLLPVIIAAIPATGYRLIKHQNLPYFIEITWLLWLIIVLSKVLIH